MEKDHLLPQHWEKALDFGCGIGRLTRGLTTHFEEVHGVDVAPTMIEQAKKMNENYQNNDKIQFKLNLNNDLSSFESSTYSFIYSTLVIQHIPYPASINYVRDFVRILKPGGKLVFQYPAKDIRVLTPIQKVKTFLKIRERLALLGIGKGFHMAMYVLDQNQVEKTIENHGGKVLKRYNTNHVNPDFDGNLEFIPEENSQFFVSKLLVVSKES
ncbi:MAG: class I SAM-dependent methyltransferase [Bacteroidota bacterium]